MHVKKTTLQLSEKILCVADLHGGAKRQMD